jgi:hypothetical protein
MMMVMMMMMPMSCQSAPAYQALLLDRRFAALSPNAVTRPILLQEQGCEADHRDIIPLWLGSNSPSSRSHAGGNLDLKR